MKRIALLTICLLIAFNVSAQQKLVDACNRFNHFNRDYFLKGRVPKAKAQEEVRLLTSAVRQALIKRNEPQPVNQKWQFPLQGYGYRAIGGTNGNGYNAKGFNYLDGNKHTAHPAHDIFIADKDQDDMDDRTSKPVNVLTAADGVVVACAQDWEPGSTLKGGKFIWMYHPAKNIFTYYAHNRAIFVKPGDYVKRGTRIAEVGRTGLNAYKKRSPTHLHFSAFKLDNIPVPFNPYANLKAATTIK